MIYHRLPSQQSPRYLPFRSPPESETPFPGNLAVEVSIGGRHSNKKALEGFKESECKGIDRTAKQPVLTFWVPFFMFARSWAPMLFLLGVDCVLKTEGEKFSRKRDIFPGWTYCIEIIFFWMNRFFCKEDELPKNAKPFL